MSFSLPWPMFALKFFLSSSMVESFDSFGFRTAKGDDLQGLRKYHL